MVELEEVLSDEEGNERRVDNHKLVIYLSQLTAGLKQLETRLSAHMEAEEGHQTKVKELIDLLTSFKGFIKVAKWLSYGAAGSWAVWLWLKEHFKW